MVEEKKSKLKIIYSLIGIEGIWFTGRSMIILIGGAMIIGYYLSFLATFTVEAG